MKSPAENEFSSSVARVSSLPAIVYLYVCLFLCQRRLPLCSFAAVNTNWHRLCLCPSVDETGRGEGGGKDTTGQRKAGEEGEMWLLVSLAQARWLVMQIDVHVSGVQDVLYE